MYLLAASGFTVYLLSKSGMSIEDKGVRVGFGLKLDQQSFHVGNERQSTPSDHRLLSPDGAVLRCRQ
jgi:hypothetical protein